MRAVDVIRTKRDGGILSPAQIESFVHGATHGTWEPYQIGRASCRERVCSTV